MDHKLQQLVEYFTNKFGLEQYELETVSCYKKMMYDGNMHYLLDLELFPNATKNQAEEGYNPPGTASICYNITTEKLMYILFVGGQSFSTKTQFPTQSVKEIAKWIEEETDLQYGEDFSPFDTLDHGYLFRAEVHGYPISPDSMIEVEFDETGKLTSFSISDAQIFNESIPFQTFTLTTENVQSIIPNQLKLEQFPIEDEEKFISVYTIDEIYLTNDDKRIIPHFMGGREIAIGKTLIWQTALEGPIERQVVDPYPEVSTEEALTNKKPANDPKLTEQDIQKIISNTTDVLRTILPNESGKWTLSTIQNENRFIEVICQLDEDEQTLFNRKFIILLDSNTFEVLNYMDNGSLFEVFDAFTPAPPATLSKEDALDILKESITLTPTYVYDSQTDQFVLCGLLHAQQGVDAETGELLYL